MNEENLDSIKRERLYSMREEYHSTPLKIEELDENPITLFDRWFNEALIIESGEVNAMVLSTADLSLEVSSRVVLLKGYSDRGFLFFTNYNSRKGRAISENPKASLLFHWPNSMRQVRVEGLVVKIGSKESDSYFYQRPLESQISSSLSKQSKALTDLEEFNDAIKRIKESGEKVVRPPHWGGYLLQPKLIEFWQGGSSRTHDRVQFIKEGESWKIVRLYP